MPKVQSNPQRRFETIEARGLREANLSAPRTSQEPPYDHWRKPHGGHRMAKPREPGPGGRGSWSTRASRETTLGSLGQFAQQGLLRLRRPKLKEPRESAVHSIVSFVYLLEKIQRKDDLCSSNLLYTMFNDFPLCMYTLFLKRLKSRRTKPRSRRRRRGPGALGWGRRTQPPRIDDKRGKIKPNRSGLQPKSDGFQPNKK